MMKTMHAQNRWNSWLGKAAILAALSTLLAVSVALATGSGDFAEASTSPESAGERPASVAVGDFNGDGIQDLAVANMESGDVTVLLGDGTGGFAPARSSPEEIGVSPVSIAIGDFDGDGHQDLSVANAGTATFEGDTRIHISDDVAILLGDGSGDFHDAPGSPKTVGEFPRWVAIGDFDEDGRQDLAVANGGAVEFFDDATPMTTSDNVAILLGDGTGDFAPAPSSPEEAGEEPRSIAIGDFDDDGHQDLAVTNQNSGNVSILLGDGTGDFAPTQTSPELLVELDEGAAHIPFAWGIAVGDFNGDGHEDLTVTDPISNHIVAILLGDGTGDFVPAPTSPETAGDRPGSIAVGDVNADGFQDLAVTSSNDVIILLGDGTGDFVPAPTSPKTAGEQPESIAVGDFNADGIQDLAVANFGSNDVTILLGLEPVATIASLIEDVKALGLNRGIERSLLAKLKGAERNLANDDLEEACEKLASFVDQVMALRGKAIQAADADRLITDAAVVREDVGCRPTAAAR